MTASVKGTSVLAALTASVMAEKRAESRKLTPVAGETHVAAISEAHLLPNDVGVFMSNERLHDHAKELRRFAANALAIADGIDVMLGSSSSLVEKADPLAEQKERERAADEKHADKEPVDFNAAFKAKQEAAQASVFPDVVTTIDGSETREVVPEWTCPVHHKSATKVSAKTNREYIGCPDCNQFKR